MGLPSYPEQVLTLLQTPDPTSSANPPAARVARLLRRRWPVVAVIGALVVALVTAIAATAPRRGLESRLGSGPSAGPTGTLEPPPDDAGPSAVPTTPPPALPNGGPPRLPVFGPVPLAVPVDVPSGTSAPYFSSIPTTQKVAFITIDDGFTKDPKFIEVLRASHVRVTLFLEINAIMDNPEYFRQLQSAGAVIEAHTITHPELIGTSYDFQKHEICGSADQLRTLYGRRPQLFRPPFGDKDATTLRVVHDCGMKAAFFWKETINAGIVRFQVGSKVQPGDIMLMHFRPTVVQDFIAGLQAIKDAGLTPALLEDYIGGDPPPVNPPPATDPVTPTPTPTPTPSPDPGTPPEGA
jgi:peptidoglycan/xylan/chitin deacetylase (PgdA/CDA1 family)